jgi:hypothetical protein
MSESVGPAVPLALLGAMLAFFSGLLPIPVGYERGRVAWLMWCGTGMHPMIVYRTPDHGFQTLHPEDRGGIE